MLGVLVAVLSAAGFLAASLLALTGRGLSDQRRAASVALAAGILLALSFADLFPESLDLAGDTAVWTFVAGFAVLFVVELLTRGHTHHSTDEHVHAHPLVPFVVGLAIHNVADGFALGISSELSASAALAMGLGVFIHQVPVGISVAAVLASARLTRAEIWRIAGLLAAAIPLSAGITVLLPAPGDETLGALVGFVAGVLTYMGASHLLPEAQREHPSRLPGAVFVVTLTGMTLILLTLMH